MKTILILLMSLLAFTGYSQDVITKKKVVVKDVLRFEGGNPDSLKIAVSVDGNGNFKWVYFSDFQDSINTGVYDSIIINYLYSNTVRVNRDSFTDPAATIASIGDSGFIVQCAASCDDIRWTTIDGTQTVLKDSSDLVGIGTSAPTASLHVDGSAIIDSSQFNFFMGKNKGANGFYDGSAIVRVLSGTEEITLGTFWNNDDGSYQSGLGRYVSGVKQEGYYILDNGSITIQGVNFTLADETSPVGAAFSGSYFSVVTGDTYISTIGKGIISKSPDGTCWRTTVDNSGNTVNTSITCP